LIEVLQQFFKKAGPDFHLAAAGIHKDLMDTEFAGETGEGKNGPDDSAIFLGTVYQGQFNP